MFNFFQFLFPKTIHKETSVINGKIEVVEQFGKRSIRVQNLEQSGPMVEKIWEKGIKKITNYQLPITNVLILGLGGGSIIKVIKKHFPKAKILGIEIDPIMIELGKKYLNLSEYKNLEIKICDAFKWIKSFGLNSSKFDLILVDLYFGFKTPEESENEGFMKSLQAILTKNGVVIFNRLRGKGKEKELKQFLSKLKKIYGEVKIVKPLINYLIICTA